MLEFAEFLTVSPANVGAENVEALREVGWADEDVVDIVHITALYNYMVRIADGLGVELDPGRDGSPLWRSCHFETARRPRLSESLWLTLPAKAHQRGRMFMPAFSLSKHPLVRSSCSRRSSSFRTRKLGVLGRSSRSSTYRGTLK